MRNRLCFCRVIFAGALNLANASLSKQAYETCWEKSKGLRKDRYKKVGK
jgi:hypothetical protein